MSEKRRRKQEKLRRKRDRRRNGDGGRASALRRPDGKTLIPESVVFWPFWQWANDAKKDCPDCGGTGRVGIPREHDDGGMTTVMCGCVPGAECL